MNSVYELQSVARERPARLIEEAARERLAREAQAGRVGPGARGRLAAGWALALGAPAVWTGVQRPAEMAPCVTCPTPAL